MGHPVQAPSLTRLSLHRLAEHVLAAALHQATGRIGLHPRPGGITTPPFGSDGPTIAGFWNAPFGAYRAMQDISSVDHAVAFLLEGHDRAAPSSRSARRNA